MWRNVALRLVQRAAILCVSPFPSFPPEVDKLDHASSSSPNHHSSPSFHTLTLIPHPPAPGLVAPSNQPVGDITPEPLMQPQNSEPANEVAHHNDDEFEQNLRIEEDIRQEEIDFNLEIEEDILYGDIEHFDDDSDDQSHVEHEHTEHKSFSISPPLYSIMSILFSSTNLLIFSNAVLHGEAYTVG